MTILSLDKRPERAFISRTLGITGVAAALCLLTWQPLSAATCRIPLPLPNPEREVVKPPSDDARPVETVAVGETNTQKPEPPSEAPPEPAPLKAAAMVPLPKAKPDRAESIGLPLRKPDSSDSVILLKPLLYYQLSAADRRNLTAAAAAMRKGRFDAARKATRAIDDDAARKVAEWLYISLRRSPASAEQIEAFRKANPLWPGQKQMRRRAEGRLLGKTISPESILAFFEKSAPVTGAGMAALAGAHLSTGDKEKARALIVTTWREHVLDKATQKLVLKRFGDLLTKDDHMARVDKLLYQGRRSLIAPAQALAALVGDNEVKAVKARAAVIRRSRSAGKLLETLPADSDDVGVTFHRVQWLRRKDREREAWDLLEDTPSDADALVDVNKWWIERAVNTRDALNAGCFETAYKIASRHGPVSGRYASDGPFMAGWIALQFLEKPDLAKTHFEAKREAANGPKTIARAEYWLGRTALALGKTEEANRHFTQAAEHGPTFHGLLALDYLNPDSAKLDIPATPKPDEQDLERLMEKDAARALGVLNAANLDRYIRPFLYHLARTLDSPAEIALIAEFARHIGKLQASVRMGKVAFNRGLPLAAYAFPTEVLPDYRRLNTGVEHGLIHAVTRQESEFNVVAKSHAGARGLMQLMPRTARAIARSYKVRYRRAKLTEDASYNVMLGAAHLKDLVEEFRGSYIMALAAYNAGGPRVNQWVRRFGDPRDPSIDPLDWVEQIPFTETRRYVQKILTGLQIYRARLEDAEMALQITEDLNRGQLAQLPTYEPIAPSAESGSRCHIVGPDQTIQVTCH